MHKYHVNSVTATTTLSWFPYDFTCIGFSSLQRIAIGLVLSTLGMAAAAWVEKKRLSVAIAVGRDELSLPISVYLLIPQFFLVGAGEAFIYTGQLDFFITQAPKSMKTMSTGLFLTTLSLGFFLSSFLVSVIKNVTTNSKSEGWLADDINYGRLDYFYWLLTVLSFINFVAFMICAIWFKPPTKKSNSIRVSNANGSYGGAEERC